MSSQPGKTYGSEKPDTITDYHDASISPAPADIDPEGHVAGTRQGVNPVGGGKPEYDEGSGSSRHNSASRVHYEEAEESRPRTWYGKGWKVLKTPGSALQIVVAAVIALAIGMAVNVTVDEVPNAAIVILGIPGRLWLRSLTAVVLPLIITAMILSIQRLKELSSGGTVLAKWAIIYYLSTTLIAIGHSILMTALVWRPLYDVAEVDSSASTTSAVDDVTSRGGSLSVEETVQTVFDSFITNNIVNALAENALLAVLIVAIVVGSLIKGPSSRSPLLALVKEVDRLVTIVVTFLIKLAPIAVFSLILSNIMRLDMSSVGKNLGILIGNSLSSMFIHLLIVFPIIFYAVCRINPYTYWLSASRAWITAWGTASSAATLPVTMRVVMSQKVNPTVAKFTVPLGCLVNMDGTAIYFPCVIVYLAASQEVTLNAGDYIIVLVLSTLASIGTTPIPSSSLVLTVMIAETIGLDVSAGFALVVAIDWFIDRFRTALNVSSDVFAARIVSVKSGLQSEMADAEGQPDDEQAIQDAVEEYNREVRGDRY